MKADQHITGAAKHKLKPPPLAIVPPDAIPPAAEVSTDNLLDVFRIVTRMEKVCTDNHGIGLAAVQVGIPWNLFIVLRDDVYECYLNCDYTTIGNVKNKSLEGCLSLRKPDGGLRRFEVERSPSILVKGQRLRVSDATGLVLDDVNRIERGLYACVFAHEIDHGKGILISDIGKEIELC